MPKVEIRKNQIWIGSKAVPLISGEVHYWRLNPNYWKEVLARVREMGLDVVATYVPWDYHEYKRGHFDFTGKTDQTRNLKKFLELTRKEGFKVIIRPGPYIYSEWPNEGAPAYAYKYHRLHPTFLNYARNYLEKVCAVIRPFLASRKGGHILMLQADNEIDPWPDIFGPQYGLSDKPGMFQDFLKGLYENRIERLNASWGTAYSRFEEAGPFIATMLPGETGLFLKGDKELRRNTDYFKFKYDYSRKVAEWNVSAFRDLGIDVPIYLNLYPFFYAHDWQQMQSVSDLVGVDLYPSSELAEDEFEQRKMVDKIRFLCNVSKIPYIAEFAAGVWHARHYDTGVLTPNHYRLITLSAIQGGIAGWNWYMLVNRDNWYMSPINEWGRVRGELYEVFKQLVSVFNEIHPPSLKKITEIGVTYNPLQYAARTMSGNSPVLTALNKADIDYNLYDPRTMTCKEKFLFYSGNQWLDEVSHRNLRKYVEEGGTLIAFRDYPRKNENFQLAAIIGFEEPKSILFEFKKQFSIQLAAGRTPIRSTSSVYSFGQVKGNMLKADFGPYGKHTVGYIKKIGKGRIVHLGFDPTRELILEIMDYLKIGLVSCSPTRDVNTTLFQRGKSYYLVVTNAGDEDKSASIYLPALEGVRNKVKVRDLMTGESTLCSYDQRTPFSTELKRKDGKVIEFRLAGRS